MPRPGPGTAEIQKRYGTQFFESKSSQSRGQNKMDTEDWDWDLLMIEEGLEQGMERCG